MYIQYNKLNWLFCSSSGQYYSTISGLKFESCFWTTYGELKHNHSIMSCYVIVTTRNILWMLLSVVATLAVLSGIMTPKWLVGFPRRYRNMTSGLTADDLSYSPSIGIYNRCTKITTAYRAKPIDRCFEYVDSFFDLPSDAWKACMVFLCLGVLLLSIVAIMSLVGFFMQSVGRKSIFSLGGVIQGFASKFKCDTVC